MNSILVTGGAGFIGSNFVRAVLEAKPDSDVVTLDVLNYAGSRENLRELPDSSRHLFVRGDICDKDLVSELLQEHQIDTIVHLAAESHVDRSIAGPAPFIQTNIVGTFTLLEAAREYWESNSTTPTGRFHHVSTDEVYGSLEPGDPPFQETTPYAPNSPYAASKAASDHLVRSYAHTFGLPITISNCSNNYGPYQFPEKLIPLMILNALSGQELPIYGDGQQIRDWLHVDDHCQALLRILDEGELGETYNIGGDNQITNLEIVRVICSLLDERLPNSEHAPFKSLITFVTDRPGHDRRYAMDVGKIREELSWTPSYSLDGGLRDTVDWYLANQAWVRRIRAEPAYQEWLNRQYSNE